jgi:hypothetical protein
MSSEKKGDERPRSLFSRDVVLNVSRRERAGRALHASAVIAQFGEQGVDEEEGRKKREKRAERPRPSEDNDEDDMIEEDDVDDEVAEDEDAAKQKSVKRMRKREKEDHWVLHVLRPVAFDYSLLSGSSKKIVDKLEDYPSEMWECPLPNSLYTGTGKHQKYLLMNASRPAHQNTIDHFKTHGTFMKYMDELRGGEDIDVAIESAMTMLNAQMVKPGGERRVSIKSFYRKTPAEKKIPKLLDKEKNGIAICAWMIATSVAPNKLEHKTWKDVKNRIGMFVDNPQNLRTVHYPMIFEAIHRLRKDIFVKGGFVHTEFDFLTLNNSKYLIVAGHTCVDFQRFSDILGLVEWSGFGGVEHVAQLARVTIDRTVPNIVMLATNTVDGALESHSEELVGKEDTFWCFAHEHALPIKKSLDLKRFPNSLVALDFSFMHEFGVFIRANSALQDKLSYHRKCSSSPDGVKNLKLLLDCLARWESEKRKLFRWLELQKALVLLSRDPQVRDFINDLIKSGLAPRDAMKPAHFARCAVMKPIIETLHSISKSSQSEKDVVISRILYWIDDIKNACVLDEDDPSGIPEWKSSFLQLVTDQFSHIYSEPNVVLLATVCDHRFANLKHFGVADEVIEKVWEQVLAEFVDFTKSQGIIRTNNEDYEVPEDSRVAARSYVSTFRREITKVSVEWLTKWKSASTAEKRRELAHSSLCPLRYIESMMTSKSANRSTPGLLLDDPSVAYRFVGPICQMFLSAPGTTASSERGVGRVRRVGTTFRNSLSESMLEQEVVCSNFINSSHYSLAKLLEKCEEINNEMREAKEKSNEADEADEAAVNADNGDSN